MLQYSIFHAHVHSRIPECDPAIAKRTIRQIYALLAVACRSHDGMVRWSTRNFARERKMRCKVFHTAEDEFLQRMCVWCGSVFVCCDSRPDGENVDFAGR
jgi:hypothetical protein